MADTGPDTLKIAFQLDQGIPGATTTSRIRSPERLRP